MPLEKGFVHVVDSLLPMAPQRIFPYYVLPGKVHEFRRRTSPMGNALVWCLPLRMGDWGAADASLSNRFLQKMGFCVR